MNLYVFQAPENQRFAVKAATLQDAMEGAMDGLGIRLLRVVESMPEPVQVADTVVMPLTANPNTNIIPFRRKPEQVAETANA